MISPTSFGVITSEQMLLINGVGLSTVDRVVLGGAVCTSNGVLCRIISASESEVQVGFRYLI